ncbi:MAG: membrane protein insertion efficiency factor YidD [Desulfobacteraceae bacterium]|nr:MAG: membrane protein insertion efficiency factor YidD [Desulfobacteraceae bacterium]
MPAIWISGKLKRNSGKSFLIRSPLYKLRYVPIALIVIYQRFISPLWPPSCRFYPTCSTYARHAIIKHGILKGVGLALIRFSKCHPFHQGGYDPLV